MARRILPPVLSDRGLAEAVEGLAADCAVPCRADVALPGRCAASVEATAYFVVAEALTNVARHSVATSVTIPVRREGDRLLLRVDDDANRETAHDASGGDKRERNAGRIGLLSAHQSPRFRAFPEAAQSRYSRLYLAAAKSDLDDTPVRGAECP
ncbi:hypothetical protein [Paractinoplanes globisporus]|uniref:histidine kinase n=1 Tax=Paractinoplanes globisporus TaxID=113565 RepID=A0ABW6WPR4_9ACTN|nr:hypothetical protein [Actinoplanes globisporus]